MKLVRIFNEAKYFVEVSLRDRKTMKAQVKLDPEQTHKTRLQPRRVQHKTMATGQSHNVLVQCIWCGHEVQAPNYTHVQEEEQKEDGPTCGLMDGAYQLLDLRLNKPKHLIIRIFFMHFYCQLFKHSFIIIVRKLLRIIKNVCFFYTDADSSFAWC